MANESKMRTVTVQKTTRDGRVLTQEIHLEKWERGRQKGNLRGNSWERSGWTLVPKKTAAPPKEAKKVEPKTETE